MRGKIAWQAQRAVTFTELSLWIGGGDVVKIKGRVKGAGGKQTRGRLGKVHRLRRLPSPQSPPACFPSLLPMVVLQNILRHVRLTCWQPWTFNIIRPPSLCSRLKGNVQRQARIQTGLHCFTEIGQIFQMTQNRGKYNFREWKSKNICLRTSIDSALRL